MLLQRSLSPRFGAQRDVVLIYPRTDAFDVALPVFEFPHSKGLRLWVVPFCLQRRRLLFSAEMLFAGLGVVVEAYI